MVFYLFRHSGGGERPDKLGGPGQAVCCGSRGRISAQGHGQWHHCRGNILLPLSGHQDQAREGRGGVLVLDRYDFLRQWKFTDKLDAFYFQYIIFNFIWQKYVFLFYLLTFVLIILVVGAPCGQQRFYPGRETIAKVSADVVVTWIHTLLMGHLVKNFSLDLMVQLLICR